MKQIILAIGVALSFASCSENKTEINPDQQIVSDDLSHIVVHVVVEDLAANNGGCAEGTYVHNVKDAEVSLFSLDGERQNLSTVLFLSYTNKNGDVEFDDLPPGNYQIKVVSEFGEEKQSTSTSSGKVTKVFVRF